MVVRVCIWRLLGYASILLSDGTYIGWLEPTSVGRTADKTGPLTEGNQEGAEAKCDPPESVAKTVPAIGERGGRECAIAKPDLETVAKTLPVIEGRGSEGGASAKPDLETVAKTVPVIEGRGSEGGATFMRDPQLVDKNVPATEEQGCQEGDAAAASAAESEPDIVINMHELDEEAIRKWWTVQDREKRATDEFVVYDALVEGGALQYLSWYQRNWKQDKPSLWEPDLIEQFCMRVKNGAPARKTDLGFGKL